jgi:hypothetical protein
MTSLPTLVRKQGIVAVVALVVGLAVGIPLGWATVKVVNTTPAVMRADLQEDYLRMAIDSFRVNRDPNLAVQRWDSLGPAAAPIFVEIQKNPEGIDPAVIIAYGQVIETVKRAGASKATPVPTASSAPSRTTTLVGAVLVLAILGGALVIFVWRRFLANRPGREITTGVQASAQSRQAARNKTNSESLGATSPITQNTTTYVLGDDLYDESFSIDAPGGEFLGEYGVGVSETIGIVDPKKVTALEIWLFDKNDIKTATKVLLSAHAYEDVGIRGRLEAKGELIQIEAQKQIMLETDTLQLRATVVDLEYGDGAMPEKSYFDRVTLELAIWRKADRR